MVQVSLADEDAFALMCGLAFYEAFDGGGIADMVMKTNVVKRGLRPEPIG